MTLRIAALYRYPVKGLSAEPLARVAQLLGERRLRVAYPGVFLRPDVYAMHGHYADRHTTVPMFERLAVGAMARVVGERAGGPASADMSGTTRPSMLPSLIDAICTSCQPGRANSTLTPPPVDPPARPPVRSTAGGRRPPGSPAFRVR